MPTYLVVLAAEDGACRVQRHPHDPPRALDHFLHRPNEWTSVGATDTRGLLVNLGAPTAIADDIKAREPLKPGFTFRY